MGLARGGEVWRFAVRVFLSASATGGWGTVVGGYDAGAGHQVPGGSQRPLVLTEYGPITTAVTLRGANPVDRKHLLPEAVLSQLCTYAREPDKA